MKILMRRDCRYFLSCFALFWRDLDQMDFAFFVRGALSFAVKLSNLLPLSCLKSGAQWG